MSDNPNLLKKAPRKKRNAGKLTPTGRFPPQEKKEFIPRGTKYHPGLCQSLIDHMAQGYSYTTWGASQPDPLCRDTQFAWETKYPEWAEAKRIGMEKAMKFFENLLIEKASGAGESKKYDITAIIFALKTRFHREYSEKQILKHEGKLTIEDLVLGSMKIDDKNKIKI